MAFKFINEIKSIPFLGFGIGFKEFYAKDLLNKESVFPSSVDWVEIITENYLDPQGANLQRLKLILESGFVVASHGVNLSLGSVSPLNEKYIQQLLELFAIITPPWFSDHLCFSSLGQHYANDLLPLPIGEASAELCIRKILEVKAHIQIPFLIENISTYAEIKDAEWNEASWLKYILEEADCGLLLDVNNVFVNAQNHGGNAQEFIAQLPLERVVEIHMAGHLETEDLLIDTHAEPIRPEVFELFAETVGKCPNLKGVLLERDGNFPPFSELLQELNRLKELASFTVAGAKL